MRPPLASQHSDGKSPSFLGYQPVPLNTQTTPTPTAYHLPLSKLVAFRVAAVIVVLLSSVVLPLVVWYWYIAIANTSFVDWNEGLLFAQIPSTRLLLVSVVSSIVAKGLVGPLMAIHAFAAAADWQKQSLQRTSSRAPTPSQLAIIMSLYETSGTFVFLQALKSSVTSRHRVSWSPILRKAFFLLGWLLVLAYGITATDIWLHLNARTSNRVPLATSSVPTTGAFAPDTLARNINVTLCDSYKQLSEGSVSSQRKKSCGQVDGSTISGSYFGGFGTRAYTNRSDLVRPAWLNDNTAVLVPNDLPLYSFLANTTGVSAACRTVTERCVQCETMVPDVSTKCKGPESGLNIDCDSAVMFNVTDMMSKYDSTDSGTLLASANGSAVFWDAPTNPFRYGQVVQSSSYARDGPVGDYFAGDTGFVFHRNMGINVIVCDVSIWNVLYSFNPPNEFVMNGKSLASLEVAKYVGAGLYNINRQTTVSPTSTIDSMGSQSVGPFVNVYGRELSKWAISSVSGIYAQYPVVSISAGRTNGVQVTLAGLGLLLGLDGLLILTIAILGLQVVTLVLIRPNPYIRAARARLTSVLPLMADSVGGLRVTANTLDAPEDEEKAFYPEEESDRLLLVPRQERINNMITVRLRPDRCKAVVL